jgi:hypothetical protein
MKNSGVLFYKRNDVKVPVMFVNDCVGILNGKKTVSRIVDGEVKSINLNDITQKNSLYLMYQGISYLIID